MNSRSAGLTPSRFVAATCVWLLACGLVLFPVWPFLSPTLLRWVLLIVVGPPLYVCGKYLGSELLWSRVGQRISRRRFTAVQVLVGLIVMLISYALVVLAARLMGVSV